MRITSEKDSTRSDRIFLKKLHSLFVDLPNMDYTTWAALWEVSNAFTLSRSLSAWRQRKIIAAETMEDDLRIYEQTMLERVKSTFAELAEMFPDEEDNLHNMLQRLITTIILK